jgi:hypothetical protein
MRTIVCDAGPIIHLYEAHCLQLLRQMGSLYLPRSVFNEVQSYLCHRPIRAINLSA